MATLVKHRAQSQGNIHPVHDFDYSTLAGLESATLSASDVGKIGRVSESDFNSYWILIDETGPVWGFLTANQYFQEQTTNSTATPVGAFTLNDEETYFIKAQAVCQLNSAATDQAVITISGLFYRTGGGSATQEGSTINNDDTIKSSGFGALGFDFNISTNDVQVRVTGLESTTIDWRVYVELKKVV